MSVLSLVGNTPLIELQGFDTGLCKLFVKLESQNPGGSIKDRIAISMINEAEKNGILKPGGVIVEATAGNTGLGLALIAAQRGYRCVLVVPDKMSREKIAHLQALGAEVVMTRSDVMKGHPEYYQDKAVALAQSIPGGWYVNQFSNPANPYAHQSATGPEIWKQMNGKVDAIVVGVGSGGTLGGLTKYFAKQQPNLEMVIADPEGSVIAPYVQTGKLPADCGSWFVEGIGEDFLPDNADFSMAKTAYSISDKESFLTARKVLKTNGLLVGSSSGTLIAGAVRYCKEQKNAKRVVTFVCDGGAKYFSKMFNDLWMVEQGFLAKTDYGDLRDLIARPYAEGAVISVSSADTLRTAYGRMKQSDVSQIPVIDSNAIVGILDDTDILLALQQDRSALQEPVKNFMTTNLKVLKPSDALSQVIELFKEGMVAIVADGNTLYGLITKIDVVDYLRRTQ